MNIEKFSNIDEKLNNGIPIDKNIFNEAIISGNVDLIKYLYKMKIDKESVTIALKNKQIEIAKYLIINNADYDYNSLIETIDIENIEILKLMNLEIIVNKLYTIDIYSFKINIKKLFINSIKTKNIEIVKCLVEKIENISNKNIYNKISFNDIILDSIDYINLEIIQYFNKIGKLYNCNNDSCSLDWLINNAILCNKMEIIDYLYQLKCKHVNSNFGYYAIDHGNNNLEIIKYFRTTNNSNTLNIACEKGYFDIVKYLVENKITSTRAIYLASEHKHIEIVKYLVKANLYIDNLTFKFYQDNLEMIEYLYDNGGEINPKILRHITNECKLDTLKYLLEKGAVVDDYIFCNAIKNLNVLKYLVEFYPINITINEVFSFHSKHYCCTTMGDDFFEAIKFLFEKNIKIKEGLFNLAVKSKNLKIVKYFFKKGVHVDETAFKWAIFTLDMGLIRYTFRKIPISKETGNNVVRDLVSRINDIDTYVKRREELYEILKYLIKNGISYRKSKSTNKIVEQIKEEDKQIIENMVNETFGEDIGSIIISY